MELNETERWYVRSAIIRGMDSIDQSIATMEGMLVSPTVTAEQKDMARGMLSYNKQMLLEMKKYIPESLQP